MLLTHWLLACSSPTPATDRAGPLADGPGLSSEGGLDGGSRSERPPGSDSTARDDLRPPDLRPRDLRPPDLRSPDLRSPDLRPPDLHPPDLPKSPDTLCAAKSCASLGATCGTYPDGCGKWLDCGGCGKGETCFNKHCESNYSACASSLKPLGSCSRVAPPQCRDYADSYTSGPPTTLQQGCIAAGATWSSTPCSHAGTVGGCRQTTGAPPTCYSQIDWYYPPTTWTQLQTTCQLAGGIPVAP